MQSPEFVLERIFSAEERIRNILFEHWKKHTNRRSTLIIILVGALLITSYLVFIRPPDAFPVDELIPVESGASLKVIASRLEEGGVIRSALAFRIVVTVSGYERDIHAGDYLFKEPKDLFTVARALALGVYGLEPLRIRVHEGATVAEMATIFERRLGRFDRERFLAEAKPLEGYLFPDTYFFLPNASETTIIQAMRQNFDTQVLPLQETIAKFGESFSDVVIMASLLEREARNPQDRRMIAGVLWNRLKRGMLLQVDAAFLYTLGKGTFDLTTDDLKSDSPYNTYKHKGLPPTPIGSPSLDALSAAMTPVSHNYFYYLADDAGTTYYSKTYEEHLQKKRKYID